MDLRGLALALCLYLCILLIKFSNGAKESEKWMKRMKQKINFKPKQKYRNFNNQASRKGRPNESPKSAAAKNTLGRYVKANAKSLKHRRDMKDGNVTLYPIQCDLHGTTLTIISDKNNSCPTADGDVAMMWIVIDLLQTRKQCEMYPEETVLVDIGGLYGDFGLGLGSQKCKTIIYEPQPSYAYLIEQSVEANNLQDKVTVVNAAISAAKSLDLLVPPRGANDGKVYLQPNTNTSNTSSSSPAETIRGVSLDEEFSYILKDTTEKSSIYVLKVDVEGAEALVFSTGLQLLKQKKIQHVIFEYTPYHFINRGTMWFSIIPFMYTMGAVACYALHRKAASIYHVKAGHQAEAFYQEIMKKKLQTDIYCSFVNGTAPKLVAAGFHYGEIAGGAVRPWERSRAVAKRMNITTKYTSVLWDDNIHIDYSDTT